MAEENTFTKAIRQIETLRDELNQKFISENQILVIFNIFDMANPSGIKAPYLGKLCNLEGPTLTRILQALSSEGRKSGPKPLGLIHIEQDPTDKRQKIIFLTDEGERVKRVCEAAMQQTRTQYVLDAQAAGFNVSYEEVQVKNTTFEAVNITTEPPEVQNTAAKELVFVDQKALVDFKYRIENDESDGMAEMFDGYTFRVETKEDRIERIISEETAIHVSGHKPTPWREKGPVGGIVSYDNSGVVGVHKDYSDGIVNLNDIELKPQSWVIDQLVRGRRAAMAKGETSYKWRGHEIDIIDPHEARALTVSTGTSEEMSKWFGLQLEGVWFLYWTGCTPQTEMPSMIVRDLTADEYESTIEYVARRLNAIDDDGKAVFSFSDEMEDLKNLLNLNQYKKMRNALIHVVADTTTSLEEMIAIQQSRREGKLTQAKTLNTLANTVGISQSERSEFKQAAVEAEGEAYLAALAAEDAEAELQHRKSVRTKLGLHSMVEEGKERVEKGEDDDPEN